MFIQASRKAWLAGSLLAAVGVLYVCCMLVLKSVTVLAEQELGAFPFKSEDWLRYLVSSQFEGQDRETIMLTGPSTVRENLLYEQFESAFPDYSIFQGGISLGVLEDVNTALYYIEKVHGNEALPAIIVLGISPRFIANIPDERPFNGGIDRYSPHLKTVQGEAGVELAPKSLRESVIARLRFNYYKEPERMRVAFLAVLNYWLSGDVLNTGTGQLSAKFDRLDQWFKQPLGKQLVNGTRFRRAMEYDFSAVLAWLISPYKYRLDPAVEAETLVEWANAEDSWWKQVYSWDPQTTRDETRAVLVRTRDFAATHDIRLLVVNLPERDISRRKFDAANYRRYLELVSDVVGADNFVDLREYLQGDEFYDLEHTVYPGSLRLTNKVIEILRDYMATTG